VSAVRSSVAWCYEGAPDWATWLFHGAVAVPLTWALGPVAVVAFYGLREGEELLREWYLGNRPWARTRRLDHFLDVFVPVAVAGATSLLLR